MELLNFLKEIPIIAVEIIRGIFVIIGELIVARINSKNKQAKREAEAAGGNNHSTKDDHSMHGGKGNQLTDNSRKIDKSTHNHYHGPVTIQNPPQPQKIDPKRPTKSYNLGKSFEEQRDYSRAIEYFETALVEQEEATGPMSEDLARVHNALGINYYRAGATRCNDAITQFNNALAIYRANGKMETNLDAAMTKNNIGAVYQSQGKYDSALKLHKEALMVQERVSEYSTAASFKGIANVYYAQSEGNAEMLNKALKWYKKALAVLEKTREIGHPDTASIYNNIGNVYTDQCEYGKAKESYSKALGICLRTFDESDPRVKMVRDNLARLEELRGKK